MNNRPFTPYNDVPMVEQKKMARGYEFLPLLSKQQQFHGDVEVYRVNAHCNLQVGDVAFSGRETVTGYGVSQLPHPTSLTLTGSLVEGGACP